MYETNVNPASPLSSGLLLLNSQNRHYYARTIADELLGVTGSVWSEVTASSPTPVFLQPYASTVTGTSGTASGEDQHVTLYLNTDPRIGDEECVLLRFWVKNTGIEAGYIDTWGGDPDLYNNWDRLSSSNTQTITTTSARTHLLPNYNGTNATLAAVSATAFAQGPWRFLYWMWEDMTIIGVVNTVSGLVWNMHGIIYPNDNGLAVAGSTINCFGLLIHSYNLALSNYAGTTTVGRPQVSTNIPGTIAGMSGSIMSNAQSGSAFTVVADGRQIIDPAAIVFPSPIVQVYRLPRVRRIPQGFMTAFSTMTIGSDTWMYFRCSDADTGPSPILVKLAD